MQAFVLASPVITLVIGGKEHLQNDLLFCVEWDVLLNLYSVILSFIFLAYTFVISVDLQRLCIIAYRC